MIIVKNKNLGSPFDVMCKKDRLRFTLVVFLSMSILDTISIYVLMQTIITSQMIIAFCAVSPFIMLSIVCWFVLLVDIIKLTAKLKRKGKLW